jgi:lipoprotein-anchoring transpeptidase ErfK/SrfK
VNVKFIAELNTSLKSRHSRESGNPSFLKVTQSNCWTSAFAGVTDNYMGVSAKLQSILIALLLLATPAHADIAQIMGGMGGGVAAPASSNYLVPRKPVSLEIMNLAYTGNLPPGSIWVRTRERKLYFIDVDSKATVFPIGVGREGFSWSGENIVTKKAEWPDWRPPKEMQVREAARGHIIPEFVKGGKANPLGAAALYIGDTQYRIHGTSAPWSIGQAVSSGCIRMLNEHIQILYNQVQLGARVVVE